MKWFKAFLTGTFILFMLIKIAVAQEKNYSLSDYLATINGTSNIKDWNEKVEKITGWGSVAQHVDKSYILQSFKMIMQVKSMKSDQGAIFDSRTYKTLKAEKFPEITFLLTEPVTNIPCNTVGYTVNAKGCLTIAGVTRYLTLPIKISLEGDKKIMVDGAQQVKMTDYGIEPPKALFGLLTTGNVITISFKTVFLANN